MEKITDFVKSAIDQKPIDALAHFTELMNDAIKNKLESEYDSYKEKFFKTEIVTDAETEENE